MIFKNISNFDNINDYLPIFNGSLNSVLFLIFFVYHGIVNSKHLKDWYSKYKIYALLADVLIFFIEIIIVRLIYKYIFKSFSIIKFTLLAMCIQFIHDICFILLFTICPYKVNSMIDFFKNSYKKNGMFTILWNNLFVIFACLCSSYFATFNLNMNIITLITTLYFVPYVLNYV
jgi:hypothetical protein